MLHTWLWTFFFFFFLAQIKNSITRGNQNTTTLVEPNLIVDLDPCEKKNNNHMTLRLATLESLSMTRESLSCNGMMKEENVNPHFLYGLTRWSCIVFFLWMSDNANMEGAVQITSSSFLKGNCLLLEVGSRILHICQNGTRIGLVTHEYSNDTTMYQRFSFLQGRYLHVVEDPGYPQCWEPKYVRMRSW